MILAFEVGAMMQGILRHATKMELKKGYVDTHGQSNIGFGFRHLLHFD
ncbi:MAG: Tn3 family transposase [Gammaproteobacteria bacterium]|nr:Tn3 family transposase [Gammaproteobacteria bacterium]